MTSAAHVPPLSLREHAGLVRRRQKALGLALLAVLVAGAALAYWPMRRHYAETRAALARTEAELVANQERASMLPQLIQAIESLKRQVDSYKPLRDGSDIEQAMAAIGEINTTTQLANYKYDMPVEKLHPSCREQPISITFQADFVDAMSFIQKLESMDRLTRLRSLSVRRKDGSKTGTVTVSMALSLFFSSNGDVKR